MSGDELDRLFEGLPPTIGPNELAKTLGMSSQTIYRWIDAGTVTAYRMGGSWMLITEEIKTEIRKNRAAPASNTKEDQDEQSGGT